MMKSEREFLATFKKYINEGWYDTMISSSNIERWIDNFDLHGKDEEVNPLICAHFLLTSLVFYQNKHIHAIIKSIEEKMKSKVNQEAELAHGHRLSEDELEKIWQQYKEESFVCSASSLTDAGTSAHQAAREWRNITGIETGTVAQLKEKICRYGKKHIFFVDDFIGTGSKFGGFFTQRIAPNSDVYGFSTITELMEEFKDLVDFNVAVYVLCEKGHKNIIDKYDFISFYFGDYYDQMYDLLSKDCIFYDLFETHKDNIIAYISDKQKCLNGDNEFALNLSVGFTHGCPNNTLALYYKTDENWVGLLKETHPINL